MADTKPGDDPLERLFETIDHRPFVTTPVNNGGGWAIHFVDFPEAGAVSKSFSQALTIAAKNLREILDDPSRRYSGQFRVRMHPYLHRHLAEEAARRRLSMNDLIVNLLTDAVYGHEEYDVEEELKGAEEFARQRANILPDHPRYALDGTPGEDSVTANIEYLARKRTQQKP
jgi:hypothetical protein